jgi:hypothetical protein
MKETTTQLLFGVGLMVGCAIIAVTASAFGVFSATMATWVQGIGTVVAIWVAIKAARAPFEVAEQQREAARLDFERAIEHSVKYACGSFDQIYYRVSEKNARSLATYLRTAEEHKVTAPFDRLLGEPLIRWPSVSLYARCEALRGAMSSFLSAAIRFKEQQSLEAQQIDWKPLQDAADDYWHHAHLVRHMLLGIPD